MPEHRQARRGAGAPVVLPRSDAHRSPRPQRLKKGTEPAISRHADPTRITRKWVIARTVSSAGAPLTVTEVHVRAAMLNPKT